MSNGGEIFRQASKPYAMHADFFLLLKKEVGPKIEARDTKAQEISVLQATAHNKQERLAGISIC